MMAGISNMMGKLKGFFLSSQILPLILAFFTLAILFVLFRMKGVELDYRISDINKDIKRVSLENKELKAEKAKLLSTKRLRRLAKKYDLSLPAQEQIIIIK